jgi:hypothetical protein
MNCDRDVDDDMVTEDGDDGFSTMYIICTWI